MRAALALAAEPTDMTPDTATKRKIWQVAENGSNLLNFIVIFLPNKQKLDQI